MSLRQKEETIIDIEQKPKLYLDQFSIYVIVNMVDQQKG